jgi:MFS family permease
VRREATGATSARLSSVRAYVAGNARTFVCHNLGYSLLTLAAFAFIAWTPTCLMRTFGLSAVQAAIALGTCMTVFATFGSLVGGWLADRGAERAVPGSRMRVGLYAAAGVVPCMALFPFMPTAAWAIVVLAPVSFCLGLPFGAAVAAIQEIAPARMRGQLSALYLFAINLIGLGIGPTAVALLTVVAATAAVALFRSSFGAYEKSVEYAARWSEAVLPAPGGPASVHRQTA